jgi:hypothetical protein
MIYIGYIQKTVKGELHVRRNIVVSSRNQRGKVLEDSRRLSTEGETRH